MRVAEGRSGGEDMTTHGSVAKSMRQTIEDLREANAGLARENKILRDERDAALVHETEDLVRLLEEAREKLKRLHHGV